MAVVPENVVKAIKEARVSYTMPKPTFQIKHKPDGSMVVQIFTTKLRYKKPFEISLG